MWLLLSTYEVLKHCGSFRCKEEGVQSFSSDSGCFSFVLVCSASEEEALYTLDPLRALAPGGVVAWEAC